MYDGGSSIQVKPHQDPRSNRQGTNGDDCSRVFPRSPGRGPGEVGQRQVGLGAPTKWDQTLKCSILRKKEREKQTPMSSRQRYMIGICFAGQDTIECMIGFRIDSCTVKRGTPKFTFCYLSATRWINLLHMH